MGGGLSSVEGSCGAHSVGQLQSSDAPFVPNTLTLSGEKKCNTASPSLGIYLRHSTFLLVLC